MKVFLNGKFVKREEAKISIFDHGLLYGDGVFEGIRAYNGLVFRVKEHIDRLFNSAKVILLNIPLSKEVLAESILELLRQNSLTDAYIRVVVTRGVGDLGLDPRKCKEPTIFIIADNIVLYPETAYSEGLEIITVPTRRNIQEALNPCIKSLNYLNNILAKIEANRAGAAEALMLSQEGFVCECTGDNIFIVKDEVIQTPPTYIGALDGITRRVVMEIAQELKIKVEEKLMTRYDLYVADEVFLTGTAAEVIPVREIDSRIIADGKPGEITRKIMARFKEKTRTEGVAIYK